MARKLKESRTEVKNNSSKTVQKIQRLKAKTVAVEIESSSRSQKLKIKVRSLKWKGWNRGRSWKVLLEVQGEVEFDRQHELRIWSQKSEVETQ